MAAQVSQTPRSRGGWRRASATLKLLVPSDPQAAVSGVPAVAGQPRRAGFWPCVALVSMAVFFVYFALRVMDHTDDPPRGDFGVYYRAGQDMGARQPLYYTDMGIEETFKSAPAVALAATQIAWLPPKLARLAWYVGDVGLLGIIFLVSFQLLYADGRWTAHRGWLMLAAFLLTLNYIVNQFAAGQPTTCWVALSMLAFQWSASGKQRRAGAALAAAVCLKVVPLCFVPHLLLRGRGRAGAAFAASLTALLLLPAGWVGWDANRRLVTCWMTHLHSTLTPNMLWEVRNQSLLALLARFLTHTQLNVEWAQLDLAIVGQIWLGVSVALALTMNGWFLLSLRGPQAQRRDAAILSLLLIFMTVCNPLGWRHNSIALVLPYYLVIDSIARSLERRRTLVALLVASLLLNWFRTADPAYAAAYWLQVYGGRFWSNVVLAAAVVVAYRAANVQRIRLADEPAADLADSDMRLGLAERKAAA